MNSPVDTLLSHLEGVKKNGKGYLARCPAHEDSRQSLTVAEGEDGRALVYCHAGCELGVILAAVGMEPSDLFESKPEAKVDVTYDYTDEQGKLLYQVVRLCPKDFRQRRPAGDGWEWNLEGVRRVLYHLPRVLEEAAQAGIVHVAEGEKDVEALYAAGAIATCNAGGAGKWREEYSEALRGAHVIVIADKDEPGRKHAAQVAKSLEGKAASVVIVEARDGKDAADHLAAGYGLEDFVPVGTEPAPARLKILTASELLTLTPERPDWIAEPLVARECISDLVAGPKVGKSTLSLALAAAVSAGRPFLGKPTARTGVLYLTEERAPTFRAAIERVGAGAEGFRLMLRQAGAGWKWHELVQEATFEALKAGAGLLVIDSLADWAELKGDAENSSGAVLDAFRPVQAAAAAGLAVLIVRHDKKGPAAELGEAGRGSNAAAGACDILMGLRKTLGAGHENRRRLDYLARFDGLPPSQVIEWRAEERTFALLGTEADIERRACRDSVRELLSGDPMTETELLAAYSDDERPPRATLRWVLGELIDAGEVERTGEGKKGKPYRYSRRQVFPC